MMNPFHYTITYMAIFITGIVAKPPYGDNRGSDYKHYDVAGGDKDAYASSYPYGRAPAASDNYRRYRDEHRARERNPYYYRRFPEHGRPSDYEYNRQDNGDPTATPTPATPPSPTPKPPPQKNDINADILTVKEIRLGPWIIRNEEYDNSNHLVIVDSTNDDNRVVVDSDGTLHVKEMTIDTDWTLRQEGSNMVIRDNTGGNNRLALARGLGTCWTLDSTCRLTLNALTVVRNWQMTEEQGSLVVKNVNNANDRLKLSPGMGPWTMDSTRTMDLNTINVGPAKKWVIRQETVPTLPTGTKDILAIRDGIGAPGSDERAAFTFAESGEMSTNAVDLKPKPVVNPPPVPVPLKAFRVAVSTSLHFQIASYQELDEAEVPATHTSLMTIDADGEMLIKGIKVGEPPSWAIRVDDGNKALLLKDITAGSNPNNQAVFMPGLLESCWTFNVVCSLTLDTLTAQTALILGSDKWKMKVDGSNVLIIEDLVTSGDHWATFSPGLGTCWNFGSTCSLALKELTIGTSGQWVFREATGGKLVLRYSASPTNLMIWQTDMGAVTWGTSRSLTLDKLFIGTGVWVIQLESGNTLILRDITTPPSSTYDHRMALSQGMTMVNHF